MRLLHVQADNELAFTRDLITALPDYAILSHTWGAEEDEVAFDDIKHGIARDRAGYEKIQFCQDRTAEDGLRHFWIDSCCIDRSNHTELAGAIVSMYQWYRNAAKCYVFLSDVSATRYDYIRHEQSWESAFAESRWFKRGWTLQELLAPRQVAFYSKEGLYLGDKTSLESKIHKITNIPISALRGAPLSDFTAAERMKWTSGRNTTRLEDQAYCLLGIFDVSMSPIYGEGSRAFVRLKDEIGKAYRRDLENLGVSNDVPSSQPTKGKPDASLFYNLPPEQRRELLMKSLSFGEMDSRKSTIKSAYSTTCRWLLDHPDYLRWVDSTKLTEHFGFLWIKGKPGAGKSTLVKFAYADASVNKAEHDLLISFFFNARGHELERSSIGMYRALLFQLFTQFPSLQDNLDEYSGRFESQPLSRVWNLNTLGELFGLALGKLNQMRIRCFIDALDECDEQQVQDMIFHFEELAQTALRNRNELYICFASRHYPTIIMRHGRELILEHQTGHDTDLASYVQNHLRAGTGSYVESIRAEILKKASGIFLWAVLVVNILNQEFRRGRIYAVEQRLREVPPELSDLFQDILRRDRTNLADFALCLYWILLAERPLRPMEFYFAMISGLNPDPVQSSMWNPERVTREDLSRFVHNSSKGLAEVTKGIGQSVQFIHESVRDFLIKENGLRKLWQEKEQDLDSAGHERLKQCCQTYLNIHQNEYWTSVSASEASRSSLATRSPFLEYAVRNVLHHANEAAIAISQDEFLRCFPLHGWIKTHNAFEPQSIDQYSPTATLLYILADRGYSRLITSLNDPTALVSLRGERYKYPFFAALAQSHRGAMKALLRSTACIREGVLDDVELSILSGIRDDHTPLLWALEYGYAALAEEFALLEGNHLKYLNHNGRCALSLAAERGYEKLVALFIATDTSAINRQDRAGRTPLSYAVAKGHEAIVGTLLAVDATEVYRDRDGGTLLMRAVEIGNQAMVRLLLDKCPSDNVNHVDCRGRTALMDCIRKRHYQLVDLMISAGANIEACDSKGRTPLLLAAMTGDEAVFRLLLERGADTSPKCHDGKTALMWAALGGNPAIVAILIDQYGMDVNERDPTSMTALSWTVAAGENVGVAEFLLARGADGTIQDSYGRTPFSLARDHRDMRFAGHLFQQNNSLR